MSNLKDSFKNSLGYKKWNFLEINKNLNIKVLLNQIKFILGNNKTPIKSLLIIIDRGPFYGAKFINIIFLIYAHILKVNVHVLCMGGRGEAGDNMLLSDKLLTKILGYNLNIKYYYNMDIKFFELHLFDLVLLNLKSFEIFYLFKFNIFEKLKYSKIVSIDYLYEHYLVNLKKSIPDTKLILRQELPYWFFSKLITNLSYEKKLFYDRKYDLIIAGSPRGRDYNLIKYLISKNKDLKICIISGTLEDIEEIKEIVGESTTIDYVLNTNSYSGFYKILNNSKIFLNCINVISGKDGYGSTGLLLPMSGNHIILSRDTKFYRKYIKEKQTGFFYDTYEDCLEKIDKILKLDINKIDKIEENRYNEFNSNKQIEDYCDELFKK